MSKERAHARHKNTRQRISQGYTRSRLFAEFGPDRGCSDLTELVVGELFQMLLDTFELTLEPLV